MKNKIWLIISIAWFIIALRHINDFAFIPSAAASYFAILLCLENNKKYE